MGSSKKTKATVLPPQRWQSAQGRAESASELLQRFGTWVAPVPLDRILQGLGIDVMLSPILPSGLAGQLFWNERTATMIVLKDAEPASQRYTLAYLLASLMFAEEESSERLAEAPLPSKDREFAHYARELLLPGYLVEDYCARKDATPEGLAQTFMVPADAARERLHELGLSLPKTARPEATPREGEPPQESTSRAPRAQPSGLTPEDIALLDRVMGQLAQASEAVLLAWKQVRSRSAH